MPDQLLHFGIVDAGRRSDPYQLPLFGGGVHSILLEDLNSGNIAPVFRYGGDGAGFQPRRFHQLGQPGHQGGYAEESHTRGEDAGLRRSLPRATALPGGNPTPVWQSADPIALSPAE